MKRYFVIGVIFGLILLFVYIHSQPDGLLHLVFCDVGQGDGAYLEMPNGNDILIDGGPNDKVLQCLGNNMSFYERTIDLVILTHPEKDHLQGLISVLERYSVKSIVIGVAGNESDGFRKLIKIISDKNIPYKNLYTGDIFSVGDVKFDILWPEKQWVADRVDKPAIAPADAKAMAGAAVLGLDTENNLNEFSLFMHLRYGEFDALFTGDGDSNIQDDVMNAVNLPDIELLKFPHHGSKTGILPEFLDKVKPEAAVISSGKNPWGHPTKEALNLLSARKISIFRTDQLGEIELVSNGKNWYIQK